MLNAMLKDGMGVIRIEGKLGDICADVAILVRDIYQELSKDDKDNCSETFKNFVQECLPTAAFTDPEELEAKLKELQKETKQAEDDFAKKVKELKSMLDELKGLFE